MLTHRRMPAWAQHEGWSSRWPLGDRSPGRAGQQHRNGAKAEKSEVQDELNARVRKRHQWATPVDRLAALQSPHE